MRKGSAESQRHTLWEHGIHDPTDLGIYRVKILMSVFLRKYRKYHEFILCATILCDPKVSPVH